MLRPCIPLGDSFLPAGSRPSPTAGFATAASSSSSSAASGKPAPHEDETPVERYHRLVAETEQLRQQLRSTPAADVDGAASVGVWGALSSGVADLQTELDAVAAQLHKTLGATPPAPAAGTNSSAAASAAAATPAPPSPASTELLAAAELEARLAAAEAALGLGGVASPTSAAAATAPSPALASLEKQLAALTASPAALTSLAERADKAAARLRSLADARAAAQAGLADPDAMVLAAGRLAAAAQAAEALQTALTSTLPAVASRLLTLDTVHREAALFTQRLAAVEEAAARSERRLAEDAELLREVRAGLAALGAPGAAAPGATSAAAAKGGHR